MQLQFSHSVTLEMKDLPNGPANVLDWTVFSLRSRQRRGAGRWVLSTCQREQQSPIKATEEVGQDRGGRTEPMTQTLDEIECPFRIVNSAVPVQSSEPTIMSLKHTFINNSVRISRGKSRQRS